MAVYSVGRYERLFFFNDTATTEIYTLSLHDALPIYLDPSRGRLHVDLHAFERVRMLRRHDPPPRPRERCVDEDRKSTRLNSSHANISYAVFCLKKKKTATVKFRPASRDLNTYTTRDP